MTQETQENGNVEFKISGAKIKEEGLKFFKDLGTAVEEVIHEGNVRQIVVKDEDGDVVWSSKVTPFLIAGGILLFFAPLVTILLSAVGLATGTAKEWTLVVEKHQPTPAGPTA